LFLQDDQEEEEEEEESSKENGGFGIDVTTHECQVWRRRRSCGAAVGGAYQQQQ
jgi:hypothetical protein